MTITESDQKFLLSLCENYRRRGTINSAVLCAFRKKLEKATVVPIEEVPRDVATINSRVLLYEYSRGLQFTVMLVLPLEEDLVHKKISVFSPIGSGILGQRVGEVIVCGHRKKLLLVRIDRLSDRETLPLQPIPLNTRWRHPSLRSG